MTEISHYADSYKIKKLLWESSDWKPQIEEFIKQQPHLGRKRYYVCPKNLIDPDEIKNGFGLYYFTGEKFYLKKKSKSFKCDIYSELKLLSHAFRKYAHEGEKNILINRYDQEGIS